MIKNNTFLFSLSILLTLSITSCEKDFTDTGTSFIKNNKFSTSEFIQEIEITKKDIVSVRADNNTIGNLGEYLLGVYKKNKGNEKKLEASISSTGRNIYRSKDS